MSDYIEVKVDDLPEVEHLPGHPGDLVINGWWFDKSEPVTLDDVKIWVAAMRWFEQHPEAVPDGD